MSSPVRSVVVRLAMDPSSYVAGAAKAERSTLALDAATAKVGPHAATSMEQAAAGAGKAEGALGKLNKTTSALGFTLGGLAGVGSAVAVGMSVKWAADYQQSLTKLVTTAGEAPKNLAAVSKGMLDMAGQVGISAQELAQGMYIVDSANIHGADSLTVLKAAAQGAKQENADLSHVVDAVTTALHDYNLPASDAAKVTSQLITAVSHGKTTFDELTGAMHSVTPLAAALNVPLSDIAGTLSAMTASGESADQAAQNMADALRHMQNPTLTMTAELAQLGINSAELGPMLGQKGLAGTIQTISTAIVNHLDPATRQVLLPALNKSKTAAQDLQIMLGQMPPTLGKLSKGLLDGSVSISDYQKAAKSLSGQQGAMGLQFLSLVKSSQGFSNILKSGAPAAQTYTAALQKAMGTSAGLTVALQVTGEHAAATNAAIADIAHSAGDAQGNIKGWAEVQGNFNQQMAQAEQGIKSLAIEAGQHLLPALTDVFRWIASSGVPGVEHLASGVGGLVHGFQQLPAPVKDAALAFAALKVVSSIGFLSTAGTAVIGGVGKAVTKTAASVTSLSGEMTLQQALFAAEARDAELATSALGGFARAMGATAASGAAADASLTAVQRTMFGYDAALAATVIEQDAANASLSRMGAGGATLAARGLSAVKSAGSGLLSMLGGPWGAALIGATVGFFALKSMVDQHNASIKADTDSVTAWQKAIAFGGNGAADAAKHLDDLRQKIADNQKVIDSYNRAAASGMARGGMGSFISQQKELQGELDKGTKAWKDQLAGMTPVEEGTQRVTQAQHDLAMALKSGNTDNIRVAYNELAAAQTFLSGETNKENTAQMTQNQLLEKAASDALSSRDAAVGLHLAQLNLSDSISQVAQGMKDGTLKGNALAEAQLQLAQDAKGVAEQAGRAAAAIATQNGETDTGTTSNMAMLASLKETAKHLSGPALDAVNGYITDLQRTTSAAGYTTDKVKHLGATVTDLPSSHLIVINAPTAKQEADLHRLGYVTATLPDGHVVVTADVNPAEAQIRELLQYARTQAILIRASVSTPNYGPTQRPGAAIGGIIHPFADGGWYTPMSGKVASIVAPQTYRLIGDRVSGDEAFIPIDGSARSQQILTQTAARMGYRLTSEQPAPMRTREMAGAGGGGVSAAIDYRQLAAAVAAAIPDRPTVHVDRWDSTAGQTPYENAEALAYLSRTRT